MAKKSFNEILEESDTMPVDGETLREDLKGVPENGAMVNYDKKVDLIGAGKKGSPMVKGRVYRGIHEIQANILIANGHAEKYVEAKKK